MGADNSETIIANEAVPVSRKLLGPAFRMAVIAGALESVRLHLRAANDVNALDEKGRTALILAASKGQTEVCRLLLEAGADPALKDSEGNDALAVAPLRARADLAALLLRARNKTAAGADGNRKQEFNAEANGFDNSGHDASVGTKDRIASGAVAADGLHIDAESAESENDAFSPVWPDEDGTFDPSAWREDIESIPPADDPKCRDEAGALQTFLSRHIPIDTDETWNDVEIDLPELEQLGQRRIRLTDDARQALRSLVTEALRDGRVRADRISTALPEVEEIGEADRAEIQTGLQLALCDLGIVIDDEYSAPDTVIDIDEEDDELFGETATDAVNFVGRLLSNDADPFALYAKGLPLVRLAREEETALGTAIQEGARQVFAAVAASPAAVSRLHSDFEAVLAGELPARTVLDAPLGEAFGEGAHADDAGGREDAIEKEVIKEDPEFKSIASPPPPETLVQLEAITKLCRRISMDKAELAHRLADAELTQRYLGELKDIASRDVFAGNVKELVGTAHSKAEKAKKRLVDAHLRFVVWVAKKYGGLPLLDRVQEGNIGLMRAADRFDPRFGAKFSSYAVWWVRQGIMRAAADTGRTIRIPVHVHERCRKVERARLQGIYETGREPSLERIAALTELPLATVRKLIHLPDDPVSMDSEPEVADGIGEIPDEQNPSPEAKLIAADMQSLVREQLGCLKARESKSR